MSLQSRRDNLLWSIDSSTPLLNIEIATHGYTVLAMTGKSIDAMTGKSIDAMTGKNIDAMTNHL